MDWKKTSVLGVCFVFAVFLCGIACAETREEAPEADVQNAAALAAMVKKDGKFGYIDNKGGVLLQRNLTQLKMLAMG